MLDSGILLLDEVPVLSEEYNIQGHTDGILDLGDEYAILELKVLMITSIVVFVVAKSLNIHYKV